MGPIDPIIALLAPEILLVVEIIKWFVKMEGTTVRIVSAVVGIALALTKVPATIPAWYYAIPIGLLAGLVTSAGYKFTMRVAERIGLALGTTSLRK